jgi:hypothetical protein
MRLERLNKLKKKYSDLIGNRTHDLSACSKVSQPTVLPRALSLLVVYKVHLATLMAFSYIA